MRGDIHRLKNDPKSRGHEQKGDRFCVVLQTDAMDVLSTVVVAPTTSQEVLPAGWRVPIRIDGEPSTLLLEHMKSVDRRRISDTPIGMVTLAEMQQIDTALTKVFGL